MKHIKQRLTKVLLYSENIIKTCGIKNMTIGIIGVGFVGGAIKNAYEKAGFNVICVDKAKGYSSTIADLLKCEGIFVAVPSPVSKDGSCDTSYLEDVMLQLSSYDGIIISKVTAPPSVYKQLQLKYKNLVHSPEFLTAANSNDDYLHGKFAIVGGLHPYRQIAASIIMDGQMEITADKIKLTSIGEASLAKYAINTFLATKVIFYNELQTLANHDELNYNVIKDAISLDVRQGNSHFDVPGPDGQFGFGGACFPKDTSAILKYASDSGVNLSVIEAAVKANEYIR